jgi:putative ABC transport system ATP-binding protein
MLIDLETVEKVYGKETGRVCALTGVDLQIERGEYVALLGPSGSGKSTLLQIVGCLDRPTTGRYRLDGVDVGKLDVNAMADVRNQRLGFVFQRFHLLPRATALENVALPLRFAKVGSKERQQRAEALLERVGLTDRMTHRPSEMSGGQQQRVAIARALANEPPLVLADEPTGNLDSKSGQDIIELLESLCSEGKTVIVVTHDQVLAERTRRIVRLLDGKIVEDTEQ